MSRRFAHQLLGSLMVAIIGLAGWGTVAGQESQASLNVELKEYQESGITGTAVLSENPDGGVHVSMTLVGGELDGNHPTHIHTGTCDNFDPQPLYPLETVNLSPVNREGLSETDVPDVSLNDLREGDYVILVHQSPEELTNYLVCGEISAGTDGTATAPTGGTTGSSGAHHMPGSGVGFGLQSNDTRMDWAVAFGTLALVLVASASLVRRRFV